MVTISNTAREITQVSFVAKDFDTYVTEIESFLRDRFGTTIFNNFRVSGLGRMLIEMMAWGLSNLAWMMDRAVTDMYIETVEVPSVAAMLARQLGVKPNAAVPSSVDITITLLSPQTSPVVIDAGTALVNTDGILFEVTDRVDFAIGEVGPKIATVAQVETREELFVSDGEANQVFSLTRDTDSLYIASDSVQVWVDNVEWEEKEFIEYEQTDHFQVDYVEFPPKLRFGDGYAGNIPPVNAEIRAIYKVTRGSDGDVEAASITQFQDAITVNFTIVPTTVTNILPSSGGANSSTVNEIRALIPKVFAAALRAVSQTDYDALINTYSHPIYGSVAIGRATIVRSFEDDAELRTIVALLEGEGVTQSIIDRMESYWNTVMPLPCGPNIVSCRILSEDASGRYIAPTSGLVQALQAYLGTYKESTVNVKVVDGSIDVVTVDADIKVSVDTNMVSSVVIGNVSDAVTTLLLNRSYGESIRIGDVYSAVEEVDGVLYSQIVLSPSAKRNSYGDIVVTDYEVITLGTVTTSAITE